MREFVEKLESGEYIHQWNGFKPFYAGCFYGDSVCLGGEEKYTQCWGWFSGIGDVEWWIQEELDKLSQDEKDELLRILTRNKEFHEKKNKLVPELAKVLDVEPYQIHRMKNKELFDFLDKIDKNSN